MPNIAIPVKCPKCGAEKIYKPRGDTLPDKPRSKCRICGYYMYIKNERMDTGNGGNDNVNQVDINESSRSDRVLVRDREERDRIAEELDGMSDLELLHFHFREKLKKKNPDLRVLDSFRQFLKEMNEFERAQDLREDEIEEELQTKGVKELVQLALGERRLEFSPESDESDSSSRSASSLDS